MIVLSLLACDPLLTEVTMSGTVLDAPANAGSPVADAIVTTLNGSGALFDDTTTGTDGGFEVLVPAGAPFFVGVEKSGYVSTSFSGTAGVSDFGSGDGYPWLATAEWVAEQRATWSACAAYAEGGALVLGQVLASIDGTGDYTSWPPMQNAEVVAVASDGQAYDGCYQDDDGNALSAGTATSTTGMYAVFGLPAGAVELDVTAPRSDGEDGTSRFQFVAFDDGLVPVFPTPLTL